MLARCTTTRDASRCIDTNVTSNPSLCNKSLRARNKVTHVELLRELAPVPRYAATVIYKNQQRNKQNRFSALRKKGAKLKTKRLTATLGKPLFLIKCRMRYAIYMPPNTKVLAINQTMVTCGNRQNATDLARANNSDLLRSLKQLMA